MLLAFPRFGTSSLRMQRMVDTAIQRKRKPWSPCARSCQRLPVPMIWPPAPSGVSFACIPLVARNRFPTDGWNGHILSAKPARLSTAQPAGTFLRSWTYARRSIQLPENHPSLPGNSKAPTSGDAPPVSESLSAQSVEKGKPSQGPSAEFIKGIELVWCPTRLTFRLPWECEIPGRGRLF